VFNHKNVRLVGDTPKHHFLKAKVYEVTAQLFVKKRKRPFFNPTTISVACRTSASMGINPHRVLRFAVKKFRKYVLIENRVYTKLKGQRTGGSLDPLP
jgi:hypothetical protein